MSSSSAPLTPAKGIPAEGLGVVGGAWLSIRVVWGFMAVGSLSSKAAAGLKRLMMKEDEYRFYEGLPRRWWVVICDVMYMYMDVFSVGQIFPLFDATSPSFDCYFAVL